MTPQLLTEHETAKILRVSVQLLRKWRALGSGPKHIKLGKCVRYATVDLDQFIESRRSGPDLMNGVSLPTDKPL